MTPAHARGSSIARNSAINLLGLGAPLVVAVFAIPPLVAGLGATRFGILGLVWVALGYLNLLDLGLGRATTRFAAPAIRDGDQRALGSILAAATTMQLAVGVVAAALAAVAAPHFVRRALDLGGALEQEAIASFVVLAFAAPALTVASSLRGALEAGHRFGLINVIRVPVSTANFLVPLAGVSLGWTLPQIVLALVIVRVAAVIGYGLACLTSWRGLGSRLRLERARVRAMLSFGGWVTVSSLAAALLVYVDRFVVAARDSVEATGYYTVPHEIVTRLEILPTALALTLFPAFAARTSVSATGEGGDDLFDRSLLFLLAAVAPPLLALAIAGRDLLAVWLDASFAAQAAPALRLLALGMIANSLAYVPYAAIQASGRPDLTARIQLAEVPVHLALLWFCVGRWGLAGAAGAWTLRGLYDAVILHVAARRLGLTRGGPDRRLGRLVAAIAAFAALLGGAAAIAATPVPALGAAVLLLALWLGWCWFGLLRPGERTHLRAALTRARAQG